jgi:SAM-dependent methyltransferase
MNWLDAGKTEKPSLFIHPSGLVSDEAYWDSGKIDAAFVHQNIVAKSVLEFGCGNGRILKHVKYEEVYGVDISPEVISNLNNAYLVKDFHKTVDAIFSITVFIHLKRQEAIDALKWIYDHLKDTGRAYLQIPIYYTDQEPVHFADVGVWSARSFVNCVSDLGFKIDDMRVNSGEFSDSNIGPYHGYFQVLSK